MADGGFYEIQWSGELKPRVKCENCSGTGRAFYAPRGVNPFNVKLPQLAAMLQERSCLSCSGKGFN